MLDVPDRNERRGAGGSMLVELWRLDDLEVEAEILSQDVVRVKPGQSVEICKP